MMRWVRRLAFAGLAAALLGYLWSRLNQDFDDEDIDEEIPIEFDLPLESAAPVPAPSDTAQMDGDTGEGPGADYDTAAPSVAPGVLSAFAESSTQEAADVSVPAKSGTQEVAKVKEDQTVAATEETVSVSSAESPAAAESVESNTAGAETGVNDVDTSDDLTVIRGVGPVFQKRLHDIGIFTFRQLADADPHALEEDGIQGVGVDLANWIEQARVLLEEKQG